MAGAFKVFVALHVVDHASKHILHLSNLATHAASNVGKVNKQLRLMAGLGTALAGAGVIGFMSNLIEKSTEAASELENVERRVKALGGMNASTFNKVNALAWGLSSRIPSTTQAERLSVFRDLHRVFADPKISQKLLPGSLQFLTAMRSMNPNVGEQEMYAAFKGAELSTLAPRPGHTIDPNDFQHRLGILTQIYGGQGVAPSEMFAFLKMARYTRGTLTDTGMFRSAALIQELSGSTAGTTIQAMSRAMVAGKFGNSSTGLRYAGEAERMGLLENITERSKQGYPTKFGVRGRDVFGKDPVQWTQDYLLPALNKLGLDINNKADQTKIISQLGQVFGSQVAGGGMYQILSHFGVIDKDAKVGMAAKGIGPLATLYGNSIFSAKTGLIASMQDFFASLGQALSPTIIPAINALSGFFRDMGSWVRNHQGAATLATFGTLLTGAVATVVGGIVVLTTLIEGPVLGTIALITAGIIGIPTVLYGAWIVAQTALGQVVNGFKSMMAKVLTVVYGAIAYAVGGMAQLPGPWQAGLQGSANWFNNNANAQSKVAGAYDNLISGGRAGNHHQTSTVHINAPITVHESPDGLKSAGTIKEMFNRMLNPTGGQFNIFAPGFAPASK